jgi:hypothetical protein
MVSVLPDPNRPRTRPRPRFFAQTRALWNPKKRNRTNQLILTRSELVVSVRRPPMRVNIREDVQISSRRYGRDALPRDPAWHVSMLVFGFSHGRSRVSSGYGFYSRL